MSLSTIAVAAEEAEHIQALFLPIWAFPLIATVFFVLAGVIVFTYRDVANRHSHKTADADAHGHDAHH